MKINKITAALASAAILTSVFTACSKDEDISSSETAASSLESITEEATEAEKLDPSANTIKFLSHYDINPTGGAQRPTSLAIFEDVYGGKIEWIPTTNDTKYDDLSKMVLGGEEVDMFPYEPDALPKGVSENLYQPLDDYIDLDSELWSGIKEIADKMQYKGAHYVIPYSIEDPICIIYSRKMIKDENLDDPYELYTQGKWNWDSFMSMMKKFKENEGDDDRYGCTGWVGQALIYSTGKGIVGYDGTKFTNNMNDTDIEKAEKLLEEITANDLFNDSWQTYFPESGSSLFYAMAPWALEESNAANPDKDIFIVPFPKMPDADKYYSNCSFGAKMLVSGSDKAEAVAKYIECERIAVTDESYREGAKKQAAEKKKDTSGRELFISEEQWDAFADAYDPSKVSPVFDFGFGMGSSMSGNSINYESRGALRNITDALITGYDGSPSSWEELRDSYIDAVDEEIAKY